MFNLAFCNLPSHTRRLLELNKYRSHNGKREILIPQWVKDEQGRPPREMHLQVFKEGELEAELVLRPCQVCWKRLLNVYLGIRMERLAEIAPELAAYIGPAPRFMTEKDIDWERQYRGIRKWVRLAIEEFERYRAEQRQKAGIK